MKTKNTVTQNEISSVATNQQQQLHILEIVAHCNLEIVKKMGDISLLKITGNNCTVENCSFSGK